MDAENTQVQPAAFQSDERRSGQIKLDLSAKCLTLRMRTKVKMLCCLSGAKRLH
jgi:hypothetical protein